jgi:hypothetical protein
MIHNLNRTTRDLAPTLKRPLSEHYQLKKNLLDKSTTDTVSRQIDQRVIPRFQTSKTEYDAKTFNKSF